MIQIHERYTIAAPIDAVFALFSDPSRDPEWQEMVKAVRLHEEGPVGLRSGYNIVFSFMGRRMEFEAEVARHDPPVAYAYRSVAGPFSYAGEVALTPGAAGEKSAVTEVALTLEIEPRGFFGIIPEAVLLQVFRKQLQRSIAHQQRILGAREPTEAAA